MLDNIVKDNLQSVLESIELIRSRFSEITHADDFVSTEEGVLVLDAIAMRLQVVGEPQKRAHSPQVLPDASASRAAGLASESENGKLPYGRRFPAAFCGDSSIVEELRKTCSLLV
jgi:hypothetical protein